MTFPSLSLAGKWQHSIWPGATGWPGAPGGLVRCAQGAKGARALRRHAAPAEFGFAAVRYPKEADRPFSAKRFRGFTGASRLIVFVLSLGSWRATTKEHLHLRRRDLSVLVAIDPLENFRMGHLEFLER